MCEPKSSGGIGVVGVLSAAGVGLAVWSSVPDAPAPAPATPPAPAHAGFPWLTASVGVLVGAGLAALVVLLVVRVRRYRRAVAQERRAAMARRAAELSRRAEVARLAQRALPAASVDARAFMSGKVDV